MVSGIYPHKDKMLQLARAIPRKRQFDPPSEQIAAARKMAHQGKNWREIAQTLGWEHHSYPVLNKFFKQMNIRPYSRSNKARYGYKTTIPYQDEVGGTVSYKPKLKGDKARGNL